MRGIVREGDATSHGRPVETGSAAGEALAHTIAPTHYAVIQSVIFQCFAVASLCASNACAQPFYSLARRNVPPSPESIR